MDLGTVPYLFSVKWLLTGLSTVTLHLALIPNTDFAINVNDKNVNVYSHLQGNLDIFSKKLNKSRNALKTILSLVNNLYARFR